MAGGFLKTAAEAGRPGILCVDGVGDQSDGPFRLETVASTVNRKKCPKLKSPAAGKLISASLKSLVPAY